MCSMCKSQTDRYAVLSTICTELKRATKKLKQKVVEQFQVCEGNMVEEGIKSLCGLGLESC